MKAEWYTSLWRERCIDLYFDGEFVVPQDRLHYCNCAPDPLSGNWTGDCDYRALHCVGGGEKNCSLASYGQHYFNEICVEVPLAELTS